MDDGIIASRYANALLRYVLENGDGEAVYRQVVRLEQALSTIPDLSVIIQTPEEIPDERKIRLLETALGEKAEESLLRFLRMVFENKRVPLLRQMLRDFVRGYRRRMGRIPGRLRVVTQPPESLLEQLRALVRKQTGYEVEIETVIDPSLIGGFVFDIDDYLLDASVSHQLDRIRSQFVDNNKRIV